jgi:phage terminase Nu1 subunit (DNA packaging protein)
VTAAELGEFIGISARAVADLGKRGIAVKAGPGRWRLRESVSRYCDDLRRQAKGKGGESAAVERGRLAAAQADLVALRVARQRGELLDAGEVEAEWSDVLRVLRTGLLAIPSRVGARLPDLTPAHVEAIDAEVRAALTDVAGG